jgi:hydrogenase maturation protease
MGPRIVVAGIGNIFLGDDAFGVEVANRLKNDPLPPAVSVVDVGIRSLHLAYALLERPELLIAIDAVRRGDTPGTLTLIEPTDLDTLGPDVPDGHGTNLSTVMAALRTLGGTPPPVLLVGCEPESVEERIGLSPAVARALPGAAQMVREAVTHHLVHTAPAAGEGTTP